MLLLLIGSGIVLAIAGLAWWIGRATLTDNRWG
jgi:hypothetical protein